MRYKMYTDGGCRNGIGGWAYILLDEKDNLIKKESGGAIDTTNNRMEMTAILNGLYNLDIDDDLLLLSDSQLAINILFGNWKATCNYDLIEQVNFASTGINVETVWVKGHDKTEFNNMCDEMCTKEIERIKNANNN